jgi:hypothetical protein
MSNPQSKLSRRTVFTGAGVAGALAVVAVTRPALPSGVEPPPTPATAPDEGTGYRLTAHVQKYYDTTRV